MQARVRITYVSDLQAFSLVAASNFVRLNFKAQQRHRGTSARTSNFRDRLRILFCPSVEKRSFTSEVL